MAATQEVHLRRSLTLGQLIVMGIIMIQPTAPMPPYGAIHVVGKGHVVTTVLVAMVAMLCTAISYGRMARAYPAAGSAYTYVGQEVHPVLGYLTGWSMLLDYVVNPLICTIWCASAFHDFFPAMPQWVAVFFFAPRADFPSIAIGTSPVPSHAAAIHRPNARVKASGSSLAKTRPNVSALGMPWSSGRNRRKKS